MARRRTQLMRERVCAGDAGCCTNLYLILQLADIERICRHTGMHPKRFVRLYAPGEFDEESDIESEALVQLRCGRRVMGTRRRGKGCMFLDGRRCWIYEFKPLHCDCYPITFAERGGRTVIEHRREKWCGARFGRLVPAEPMLALGRRVDREQARTQRFVDRWNKESGGDGMAEEFFEYLAEEVGYRRK